MTTDFISIKSSDNSSEFQFSEQAGLFLSDGSEYYRVTLKTEAMTASLKVYAFEPSGEYCWRYFADLADNWRGWSGIKQWSSLEGEFKISSESDALGHIAMEITLESYGEWKAQITAVFDAGQLNDISSKIKSFFSK